MRSRPGPDNPSIRLLPSDKKYDLPVAQLSRLKDADWSRLVTWLESDGFDNGRILNLKQLTHLL